MRLRTPSLLLVPSMRPLLTRPARWKLKISGDQASKVSKTLVELGQRVGGVEVGEAVEGPHGLGLVSHQEEAVELLQHRPAPTRLGVGGEQRLVVETFRTCKHKTRTRARSRCSRPPPPTSRRRPSTPCVMSRRWPCTSSATCSGWSTSATAAGPTTRTRNTRTTPRTATA